MLYSFSVKYSHKQNYTENSAFHIKLLKHGYVLLIADELLERG